MQTELINLKQANSRLKKLTYYLNYEITTSSLFLASFIYQIMLSLVVIAAVILTPFLYYVLYKLKRTAWLIWLTILLFLIPLIFILPITSKYRAIILYLELGAFYFYCFILRLTANEWLSEGKAREERINLKINSEKYKKLANDYFINT